MEDPVDTDRLAVVAPETEADGWEDAGWRGWEDADPDEFAPDPELIGERFVDPDEERFDAFNASTWHFKPAPLPWYRTQGAVTAIVAVTVAVVALVVSIVLLAFRGASVSDEAPASATSSVPTTATSSATPETTSAVAPPPPPPPPETSAPPPAPPPVYNRPRGEPRQTKEPEIGVTRTPVTRSPISVRPQMPSSQRR